MKKFIALLSLVSFIQCGSSDQKSVSEVIATGTLEEIQLQKTEHVKTINQLEKELEQLNESLQAKDQTQKFVLVGSVELKEEFFQHSVSFQGSIETDKNILIYPEIPGLLKKWVKIFPDRLLFLIASSISSLLEEIKAISIPEKNAEARSVKKM